MEKNFEYNGRSFIFKEPTAKDGIAVFNMMSSYQMPFNAPIQIGLDTAHKPIMNRDELDGFMTLCLQNTFERLANNPETGKPNLAPVRDGNGMPGIIGSTPQLEVALTAQYMVFFTEYWFGESLSDSEDSKSDIPSPSQKT